jgi:hypothetical protein
MNRRHLFAASLAAVALLATSACGGGGKTYPDYRYRLTVEVDTPEGIKRGSSVIEVKTRRASKNAIPSPRMLSYKVRGEAVTVDLGQRGLLFALLRSDTSSDWAAGAFESMAPPTPRDQAIGMDDEYGYRRAKALALTGPQVLPRWRESLVPNDRRSGYPMLVRFADIADPASVSKVDPDALAASFGKGVNLRRITVERTEDELTTGIERRLEWLAQYYAQRLDGERFGNNSKVANQLSSGAFSALGKE